MNKYYLFKGDDSKIYIICWDDHIDIYTFMGLKNQLLFKDINGRIFYIQPSCVKKLVEIPEEIVVFYKRL